MPEIILLRIQYLKSKKEVKNSTNQRIMYSLTFKKPVLSCVNCVISIDLNID